MLNKNVKLYGPMHSVILTLQQEVIRSI